MNTSSAIKTLIRACLDDERTLRHESKFVDAVRAETLTELARERAGFVTQLEHLHGAPRPPSSSWTELLREAARNVWVAACGRNNGDAIAACRHSHARTQARYDEALPLPWPDDAAQMLAGQRDLLRREANILNQMQF